MKDYNEMAQAVFKRRDEYIETRKKNKALFLKAGVPVCTLLLVSVVGLSIWMAKLPEIPANFHQDKPDYNRPTEVQTTQDNRDTPFTHGCTLDHNHTDHVYVTIPQPQGDTIGHESKPQVKPTSPEENNPQLTTKPEGGENSGATTPMIPQATPPENPPQVTYPPIVSPTYAPTAAPTFDNHYPTYPATMPATIAPAYPTYPPTTASPTYCPTSPPTVNSTYPTASTTAIPTQPPTEPPTGPVEITVGDKTFTAQTGDIITYTLELQAEEKFEDIQMQLIYDKEYLSAVIPLDEDGETDYEKIVPNLTSSNVNFLNGKIKMNATKPLRKFDFRDNKVLMTVDFMVKRAGKTEILPHIEEMTIYNIPIDKEGFNGYIDGVWVGFYDMRNYFTQGKAEVTEGIAFTEYLTITPASEITPPDNTEKPTEPSPPFVYPEESTGKDLTIKSDGRTYSADVGQRITYFVELEAAEKFRNFQLLLLYDDDKLELVVPADDEENGIYRENIALPNVPGAVVNFNKYDEYNKYKGKGYVLAFASDFAKYDFRKRRVWLQLDFIVEEAGEVDMEFIVQSMSISNDRMYFDKDKQVITDGINIYQYVIVN